MSVLSKDLNVSSRESKSNSNINKTSNAIRIETFKRLAALSAPEAPRIAMGITGLIINSITNLSFPWLMGQAIDRAGNGDMTCANNSMICGISADYFWFLLKAAGIFVCGSLASWVRVYCLGTSTDIIAKKLRKMLYNGYLFKKIEHYDAARTGEMISTMEKDVSLASQTLTDKLAAGLRSLNSSINGSILLFSISPKLCFVTLAIVPVVGVGAMSISKYANRCKASLREKEVSLLSYVVERLNCITTVKVNHQENNEIARFSTQTDDVYEIAKKAHFAQGSMMGFIGLATNVSLMSILFVGGNMLSKKDITTGDLTRFAIQSAFVGLGFSGVAAFYRELMESLDGAGRVYAAVDANNKEMDANRALAMTTDSNALVTKTGIDTAADTDTAFTNAVVMKNIDFTYSSRPDQLVLNHLDLEIKTGSFSCIVGPSGVGKSTLFGLLCGLHELQQQQSLVSGGASGGSIIIGGRDIATVDKNWLYHNVSVVEQGGVGLLSGSIYYNIMYGNDEDKKDKEANMDVVRAAAGLALAHEFISSFPDGYETMVGECGKMLSGGQKARILLARALVKQPLILLLDEATASLDSKNESDIINILQSLKNTGDGNSGVKSRTIIAFTHSDLMMESADQIYAMGQDQQQQQEEDSVLVEKDVDTEDLGTGTGTGAAAVANIRGGSRVVASGTYSDLVKSKHILKNTTTITTIV